MKKTKIIIPALGLLVLSTAASVSGTVAWFSVNSSVSATSMKVKAKAEAGLLISADKTETSWADSDASDYASSVALVPTSTADLSTWYHAVSSSVNNHAHSGSYSTLGTTAGTNVIVVKQANLAATSGEAWVTYSDNNSDDAYAAANDTAYYLKNTFWLKSSGDAITVDGTNNWLSISDIDISGTDATEALDASLRIGVKISNSVKIIAPFADATASYNVGGSNTATTPIVGELDDDGNYDPDIDTGLANVQIPALTTTTPLAVEIYLWFEGEDANCKSINLASEMDELEISVQFSLTNAEPQN